MPDSIRFAQKDDLPRIVEIYNQSVPSRVATADLEPVSLESRQAWWQAHDQTHRPIWVCERKVSGEKTVIGWDWPSSKAGPPLLTLGLGAITAGLTPP